VSALKGTTCDTDTIVEGTLCKKSA
jgi:hypothetical protein